MTDNEIFQYYIAKSQILQIANKIQKIKDQYNNSSDNLSYTHIQDINQQLDDLITQYNKSKNIIMQIINYKN